jgi:hypothetical protein
VVLPQQQGTSGTQELKYKKIKNRVILTTYEKSGMDFI